MDEKIKNILKIAGICYLVSFITLFLFSLFTMFLFPEQKLTIFDIFISLFQCMLSPFIIIISFVIIFSPAILLLYLLFKKIKNVKGRIVLTAFLIPFTNMIYLLIEHLCIEDFAIISLIIGFCALFIFLPLSFISILFVPEKWLPIKWQIVITIILTEIFGWILVFCSGLLISFIDSVIVSKIDAKNLEKYEVIMENLEEYKARNGVYPEKAEDTVKKFESFYYEPINSNSGYTISVFNKFHKGYKYCTTPEPEGCHPESKGYADYEQFGKWIKIIEKD